MQHTARALQRYKLTIEYDGTPYKGWQRQNDVASVQETLERALQAVYQEQVTAHVAGRTDAGVHALGQVVHVDVPEKLPPQRIPLALNAHLRGAAVVVLAAQAVDETFHARFSATARRYQYRLLMRHAPSALERLRVWHVCRPLDVAAMQEATQYLLGHHDFTSFRASGCQASSPMRTLDMLNIAVREEEIHICAQARSFLHHQVRNMVGSLKLVGEGAWQPQDMQRALQARDRTAAGPTAPAHGLYLCSVEYSG